ncbi:unnamed protein product [Kuraishia capsulata CBS 1993]|uniref:Autophagy-related protein n=1 Tax=Kuraishia capsulata CBS 1993 TaxID=1382522 RepID=W6MSX8_9ASCO|nr:uncharacterized protein KUCA_T00005920001 [Kuraishia capsulata CBS 1993]CDK29926.1 unnamed protein product [Kuraishia capsulata CBS 1993]
MSDLSSASLVDDPEEHPPLLPKTGDGPTLKSEIWGWCLYAWASEPFIVSVVGTYVPLLLEQLARDNGVRLSDLTTPCVGAKHPSPVPEPIPPTPDDPNPKHPQEHSCVLPVLNGNFNIDTSSYALYTFSFSVFVQTLVVISMSGAADRGSYRKSLLLGFGAVGAIATMVYIFISDSNYYWASFLAIVANSCYGAVNVCGNAFLPVLTDNHPELTRRDSDSNISRSEAKGAISSKISGKGASAGYISALLVQLLTMLILVKLKKGMSSKTPEIASNSSIFPIQVVIFIVGLWWFAFQLPLHWLLKPRPGPHLHMSHSPPSPIVYSTEGPKTYYTGLLVYKLTVLKAYIIYGWKTLFLATKTARQLKDISLFLLGWFIVSDSTTTINSAAILFARSELKMSTLQLSFIGIATMLSAILSASLIPTVIQPYWHISTKRMFIYTIVWSSVIPFYGCLGFYFDSFGLKHPFEMYILAVFYGFSLGGLATVSRSLFSLLIPKGKESVFFSLFSVTDKGSSILGPAVVGIIVDKTHNIRYCFYFLYALLVVSLPVFALVDIERGAREALVLEHVDDNERE